MQNPKKWAPFLHRTLVFCFVLVGLTYLYAYSRPVFVENHFILRNQSESFTHPLHIPVAPTGPYFVESVMQIHALRPSKYYIEVDDCLDSIIINDVPVLNVRYPICNWPWGTVIDLSDHLLPGVNTVQYYMRNRSGGVGVNLMPWMFDPLGIVLALAGIVSLLWYSMEYRSLRRAIKKTVGTLETTFKKRRSVTVICTVAVLAATLLFAVYLPLRSFLPKQGMFSYAYEGEQTYITPPPLNLYDTTAPEEQTYTVETTWDLRRVHFTRYYFSIDDCLVKLWVNAIEVQSDNIPLCPFPYGDTIDLSAYLKTGTNTLKMEVENENGATLVRVRPSMADSLLRPYLLIAFILLLLVIQSKRSLFSDSRRSELLLLCTFILARLWSFFVHMRINEGWDWGYHMDVLAANLFTVSNILNREVFQMFYSYHPPLGFLLSEPFLNSGFGLLLSAKIVSLLTSFIAFFCIRQTVKYLGLLQKPIGLVFLYGGMSIPMMVFLSRSVNLDMIIFMCTCFALHLSIMLFGKKDPAASHRKTQVRMALLALTIFAGLMTKFNGLLIASLPVIVACAFGFSQILRRSPEALRTVRNALFISVVGVALAFPYYHWRYFLTQGTYFPHNGQFYEDRMQGGQEIKEKDKTAYFLELFKGSQARKEQPYWRDWEMPRLSDAWNDFWIRDHGLGTPNAFSTKISVFYQYVIPTLLLLSLFLLVIQTVRKKADPVWIALGVSLLAYSVVQFTLLTYYVWKNACIWCYSSKGIYITPVILAVAFFIANLLTIQHVLPHSWQKKCLHSRWLVTAILCIVIILHHVIPVY
ncbi:hypothetical protein COU78_05195 [Candidatus Peregrinibacteria bacterium CG10_big_fil_rev_8_21_14_0_10_49_24]|nr:MAG: hypothetical protein COV83_01565 [Candidatus Peregrinibacteria bacterium CG11_big_fil_rev_8_21_14_0_20_49_14]PIR50741.1 MAG: hypothetical protein COU78_05195 [Candidatus Peregrinibacteria bacterium CG10_big_fil_rev_8_21_14_0_10_49_24]PJA68214.1 MAG: hypothetical protein CO157_00615 [Candidatus Peregrinibacteria bacterium CG_4_9_14_3_um_filter_49_12]